MDNPVPETHAVSVEVTGLPIPAETAPAPEPEPAEIVVIHTEQTSEGNTTWQERIESTLRQAAENQQNQTLQVIQAIQGFRETLDKLLECMLKVETKLQSIQNPQPLPQEPEPSPAPVQVPAAAENPTEIIPAESPANPQQIRKRRQRI